jgi:hypothetical protein
MSAKRAILELLTADSGVTDLCDTSRGVAAIFPGDVPTSLDADSTYITLDRVSTQRVHHMTAASGLASVLAQINCWAADDESAEDLADAVREAIDGYQGTVTDGAFSVDVRYIFLEDQRDGDLAPAHGAETNTCRQILDARVWHRETIPTFT